MLQTKPWLNMAGEAQIKAEKVSVGKTAPQMQIFFSNL